MLKLSNIFFNNSITISYDIPFLSMEYLGPIIFQIISPQIIIDLLFKVLTEQSIIFISDNLIVVHERLIYNFNWQENDSILVSARNKYEIEGLTHSYEKLLDGNTYECYSFSSY